MVGGGGGGDINIKVRGDRRNFGGEGGGGLNSWFDTTELF